MPRRIIDLATLGPAQGFVIQIQGSVVHAGQSVSSAGDVNGDGFDDVIVGAPFGGDGGHYAAGAAYVVFGGADRFGTPVGRRQVVDLSTLSPTQGFVIQGDGAYNWAGWSVSAAGDVNGDGFADVTVGAYDTGIWAGKAYVVFGGADDFGTTVDGRQVVDLTALGAAEGFVIQGGEDDLACIVSAAGDVNGDGFADVIVGANGNGDGGERAGAAYVVFGGAAGFGTTTGGRQVVDLATLSPAHGFVIQGAGAGDYAGWSVSAAGDVNSDGFADVIVGAFGNGDGGERAGAAYVVFGGAGGFGTTTGGRQVVDLATLSPAHGFVIQGDGVYNFAGSSVSAAGDVNSDGFADVIIGTPGGAAYVVFGSADGFGTTVGGRQVIDLTTLSGAQGFVIQGDAAGSSVSAAGDVNGDGIGDVIVGAPGGNGATYVVFGGADGFGTAVGGQQVVELATLSPAHGFVIQGDGAGDSVGWSVSAAGDVNGDGFDDLIVGAPGNDDGGTDAGEAYVIYGGNFTHAVARIGGEGDDVVRTGPVGRIVFGAQGDDTVLGNVGADSLNGGSGDDSLNGDAANDTLAGGNGDDRAVGGFGDDRALGGDGNDTLSGRTGNDTLSGEANEDRLAGDAGDDSLDGGQGRDTLFGGDGADTLAGGGRADVLVGGAGADGLTGGSGFDRFVFAAGSSSPSAPDTICDFETGIDKLVIRGGVDHGTFLGGGAFTGAGGIEVRWDAASHQLQLDLNGDGHLGASDLVVAGQSLAGLTAHDLLFV